MRDKSLQVTGTDFNDRGQVVVWSLPLWLKSDLLIPARMLPREARQLAVSLLTAAQAVEDKDAV